MSNILDYLKWRGDLTFTQDPPGAVDALVFSALAYISYGGRAHAHPDRPLALHEAAKDTLAMKNAADRVRVKTDLDLLKLAAETVRFGSCQLCMYRDEFIPEEETQFAAMTFLLDDGSMMLAYRGTDTTLVGWKEDFNMTFQQTIPAQRLAADYIRQVAAELDRPMYLAGHSKGGNLAVFAAARSSPMIQQRILQVWNHDGPGFTKYMMGDPGYLAMVPRIQTYIPQSSVIGMLLEHEEPYRVIHSRQVSIWQHELYSWEVMGKNFLPVEDVTGECRFVDATIKAWFASMTNQERNQLVDVLYGLLSSGDVEKSYDIFHPKNIRTYLKTIGNDEKLRKILTTEFMGLLEAARHTHARFQSPALPEGEEEGK